MDGDVKISSELLDFLNREIGKTWWLKNGISEYTTLFRDLRLDGDDAKDFFESFGATFNVDLSTLDLSLYFNSEGFDPIGITYIWNWLRGRRKKNGSMPPNLDITILDLELAIRNGKWVDKMKMV